MKKSWMKKLLCAGIGLVMAIPLAACGDDAAKTANAALAKENVYRLQEFAMPDLGSTDTSVRGTVYKDGMIYLLTEVYHWDDSDMYVKNGGSDTDIRLISMKDDGTDAKVVALEMPSNNSGDTAAEDGAAADTANGTDEKADSSNVWEYTGYSNYTIGTNDKIYAVKDYFFEDYSEPYVSISELYISTWNMDGTFEKEVKLEGLRTEDEWIGIRSMTVADDGTVNLILTGNSAYKMSIDPQGNISERKEVSEELATIFNNAGEIFTKNDGTLMVFYYDENDWTKEYVATYDPATDAVSEGMPLPTVFTWGGYSSLSVGTVSDFIYSNTSGVYTYNVGDTDATLKMSYINSDMNITSFQSVVELSDKTFLGIFSENYGDTKAGIFTYVDPSEISDKAVLVLAGSYVDTSMKQRIVEYNRSNEEYRIVVKEYNSYNTYDDWQAGYTQLNNDIITGGMPDILIADNLPTEKYISKGLLADIGKLIEEDEELSGVEFMQNVFDAYSVDGKLYYVIPYFRAQTMIGKKSILGDKTSWTIKEMQELAAALPEGTSMIGEMTRDGFFNMAMQYCGSDFIDVSAGKCNFNSEGFIALMEYAKTLPTELGEDYYGEDYWTNYQSQYREERTVLYNLYISSISNLNYQINGYFGEPVSFIGFPTESGQGAYVAAYSSYVLSAKSKNLDAAWDFMKYYLTDEYQSSIQYGLPIQKKYFTELAQKATQRPYYTDEDGNKVEYDDSFYINGEEIPLPPMTQEQVDEIVAVIGAIDKCYYFNENVVNIINEEMPAFYTGQKSAQEVAQIIQSRAQIYVQENS